jgi:hypothetical protein
VFRLFARRCLPKMMRSRGLLAGAALLAAMSLVLSQMSPVRAPGGRPAMAILAPGSNGSLQHHPWWDPRGWFAAGVPKPRVLTDYVAAVPRQARLPRQPAQLTAELAVTRLDAAPRHTTYYVPGLPDPLTASRRYTVKVTLTNTTASTWNASDWVLSYHWQLPGGTDVSGPANQEQTPLPADMAPGAVATIAAALKAPDNTGSGSTRTGYVLAWDLYNKTTGTWLSSSAAGAPGSKPITGGPGSKPTTGARGKPAAGGLGAQAASPARVAPLAQLASVEQPTSNQLGLEKFYQYTGVNTGSGSSVLNNLASGNAVWSYNAFSNPSRGFATFVRMTYNSLDTSDSSMGFGWSLETSTVTRLGTPLDFNLPFHPTEITLTDGDGTSHLFVLGQDGVWRSPPGIHLFLQRLAECDPFSKTDNSRAWVMTRPDRTQFFFDCEGYQTAVVDRNGNTASFTYSQRDSYDRRVKFLTSITDPSGRHSRHRAGRDCEPFGRDGTAPRRPGPGDPGAAGVSPVIVVVGQPEELDRQLRPIGIVEPQVVGLACDAIRVDLDLAGPVDVHGVCPGGLRMIGVRQMGMQDVGPLLYLFPEVRVLEDGVCGAVPQLHARAWPAIAGVRRPGQVPPLLRRLDDVAVGAGAVPQ